MAGGALFGESNHVMDLLKHQLIILTLFKKSQEGVKGARLKLSTVPRRNPAWERANRSDITVEVQYGA